MSDFFAIYANRMLKEYYIQGSGSITSKDKLGQALASDYVFNGRGGKIPYGSSFQHWKYTWILSTFA